MVKKFNAVFFSYNAALKVQVKALRRELGHKTLGTQYILDTVIHLRNKFTLVHFWNGKATADWKCNIRGDPRR